VLKRHSVGKDLFRRWAAVKSVYAQRRSGRQCITRPKVLASTLLCKERQVQRCNAAARELGLEVCVLKGRMLTFEESTACRIRGSNQRGLSSEVALTTPSWAEAAVLEARQVHKHPAPAGVSVDSDTPTSRCSRNHPLRCRRLSPRLPAKSTSTPLRPASLWIQTPLPVVTHVTSPLTNVELTLAPHAAPKRTALRAGSNTRGLPTQPSHSPKRSSGACRRCTAPPRNGSLAQSHPSPTHPSPG